MANAAARPPAGPDNSKLTALSAATFALMVSPDDCMIARLEGASAVPSEIRYDFISGPIQAFSQVVMPRSYSRCSGKIKDERETK